MKLFTRLILFLIPNLIVGDFALAAGSDFQPPANYTIQIPPSPAKMVVLDTNYLSTISALEYEAQAKLGHSFALSADYLIITGIIEQVVRLRLMPPLMKSVFGNESFSTADIIAGIANKLDVAHSNISMVGSTEDHLETVKKYGIVPLGVYNTQGQLERLLDSGRIATEILHNSQLPKMIDELRTDLASLKPYASGAPFTLGVWPYVEKTFPKNLNTQSRPLWNKVITQINVIKSFLSNHITTHLGIEIPVRFTFGNISYTPVEFARSIVSIDRLNVTELFKNHSNRDSDSLGLKPGDWSENLPFKSIRTAEIERRIVNNLNKNRTVIATLNFKEGYEINTGVFDVTGSEATRIPNEDEFMESFSPVDLIIVGVNLDQKGKINAFKVQGKLENEVGLTKIYHMSSAFFWRFAEVIHFIEQGS